MSAVARAVLGAALGLLYARWGLGRAAGSTPRLRPTAWPLLHRGMIVIPLDLGRGAAGRGRCLHVHHWLVYAALLPWLAPAHPLAAGAALSLVAQGLAYADRFEFVVAAPPGYAPPPWATRAAARAWWPRAWWPRPPHFAPVEAKRHGGLA